VKVFKLATGLAVGYVLGSRAGRDKYEQIVAAARKAQSHPTVTQVRQTASRLLGRPPDTPAASGEPVSVDVAPAVVSDAPVSRSPRRQPRNMSTASTAIIEPPL
jgi:hypothetical protein